MHARTELVVKLEEMADLLDGQAKVLAKLAYQIREGIDGKQPEKALSDAVDALYNERGTGDRITTVMMDAAQAARRIAEGG